jgi:hypothetical protein
MIYGGIRKDYAPAGYGVVSFKKTPDARHLGLWNRTCDMYEQEDIKEAGNLKFGRLGLGS